MTQSFAPLIWLVSGFVLAMLSFYFGVRTGRGVQPKQAWSPPPPTSTSEEASIDKLNERAKEVAERLRAQEALPPTEM